MIKLKDIDADNIFYVCELTTNHNGIGTTMEEYLWCNAVSIAEANCHSGMYYNAIYNNNVLIGFYVQADRKPTRYDNFFAAL